MSTGTPHYAGHRARLRQRLLRDASALAEYEILELLLGYVFVRKDTKPLAKELLQRFGSIRGVIPTPCPAELQAIPGVGEGLAAFQLLLSCANCWPAMRRARGPGTGRPSARPPQ